MGIVIIVIIINIITYDPCHHHQSERHHQRHYRHHRHHRHWIIIVIIDTDRYCQIKLGNSTSCVETTHVVDTHHDAEYVELHCIFLYANVCCGTIHLVVTRAFSNRAQVLLLLLHSLSSNASRGSFCICEKRRAFSRLEWVEDEDDVSEETGLQWWSFNSIKVKTNQHVVVLY